jgi:hypothetical protein
MVKSNKNKHSNKLLGAVEFGKLLIETEDLDPLYVSLWESKLPRKQLCQWVTAYICFYHAGVCSYLSERKNFWEAMVAVTRGGAKYPRGSERRHFRGNFATKAVQKLQLQFETAEELVDWVGEAGPNASSIMCRVKTLYGFGDWIAGKVPDLFERIGLIKSKFVEDDVHLMFSSPKKGAEKIYLEQHIGPEEDHLIWAHRYLIRHLGHLKSPPRYDRKINSAETETIFCKYHSHLTGHYPVGKDIHEIREGLMKYARCKTAQKLLANLPKVVQHA